MDRILNKALGPERQVGRLHKEAIVGHMDAEVSQMDAGDGPFQMEGWDCRRMCVVLAFSFPGFRSGGRHYKTRFVLVSRPLLRLTFGCVGVLGPP